MTSTSSIGIRDTKDWLINHTTQSSIKRTGIVASFHLQLKKINNAECDAMSYISNWCRTQCNTLLNNAETGTSCNTYIKLFISSSL